MTTNKYTLLVGNYGHTNIGDMLLKHAALQKLSNENIKVMSPAFGDFPIFTIGFRSLLLNPSNNWQAYKAIYHAEKIVFGGGGLLNSQNKHSLFIWGSILCVSLFLNKNVELMGQSFSSPPKGLLKNLLQKVSKITVRDEFSLHYLKESGINATLTNDLALDLNVDDLTDVFKNIKFTTDLKKLPTSEYVLINARRYKTLPDSVYKDLQYWIEESSKVFVFTPFDIADVEFYNTYLKQLGVLLANPTVDLYKNASKIVGMRLHFLLVAKKLELKFTPLSYAPKVIGMFGSNNCIDLYNYNKQKNPLN